MTDSGDVSRFLSRTMKGWTEEDSKLLEQKDKDKRYPVRGFLEQFTYEMCYHSYSTRLTTPQTVGVIRFETRSIAYSISDDFKFIPVSAGRGGIVRGEIEYSSQTIKIDDQQIKTYRKRQKHLASKRRSKNSKPDDDK